MYLCLLLTACAIQLVAGAPYDTECIAQGKVVKPGKSVKVMSTCTKYSCRLTTKIGFFRVRKAYVLDQELLKDCVGVKCTKKGQKTTRTYGDKTLEISCNGQLQPIVSSAACLIGGSRITSGNYNLNFNTCIGSHCSVTNIRQEISKVTIEEHRGHLKEFMSKFHKFEDADADSITYKQCLE